MVCIMEKHVGVETEDEEWENYKINYHNLENTNICKWKWENWEENTTKI